MDKFDKFVVSLAASVVLAVPATAQAQLPPDGIGDARTIGTTHIQQGGKKATLTVRYTCTTGDHLWVSLKQSRSGRRSAAIEAEGSGGKKVAKTWLDSHRNPVVCNGQSQQVKVSVDKVEPGKYGKLRKGVAWLQFCITDSTKPDMDPSALTVYLPKWVKTR